MHPSSFEREHRCWRGLLPRSLHYRASCVMHSQNCQKTKTRLYTNSDKDEVAAVGLQSCVVAVASGRKDPGSSSHRAGGERSGAHKAFIRVARHTSHTHGHAHAHTCTVDYKHRHTHSTQSRQTRDEHTHNITAATTHTTRYTHLTPHNAAWNPDCKLSRQDCRHVCNTCVCDSGKPQGSTFPAKQS